jgi:uncharacterized protein
MRPIAVIVAALILSACGSTTNHPVSSSTSGALNSTSAAPSSVAVDCTKPATSVQQLICTDPRLTDLDHRLQTAYHQALARTGADPAALTGAQTSWAAVRDGCTQNSDVPTCLVEAYQTRLVQLAIADPATVAPPVIAYHCPADSGPLTASSITSSIRKRPCSTGKAISRFCSFNRPAAVPRYGRQGAEYWEHQGEVKLDINGTKFVCSTS